MDDDKVTEDQCSICGQWPAANRAEHRREHFSSDYARMPLEGVCMFCQLEFWKTIMVATDSQEELEALRDAVRQERRKGSLRSAHELLSEIRAKPPGPTNH